VEGAALRGNTLVLGYNGDDGYAVISFRGSTQVHSPTQLAFWSRSAEGGIVDVIAERPQVSFLYYGPEGPGPMFLSFHGRAQVAPEANDEVYAKMIEGERGQDAEQAGVAMIVEVESVRGFGADGPFEMVAGVATTITSA
jgi:hypothetical protein